MAKLTQAQENHNALIRQLRDIYAADGTENPFLNAYFGSILTVSYWSTFASPPSSETGAK